ncbi:nucleotide-sugar transporter [Moniliophthora roreri MCA 2997]|uniref:Nucleotide-sugar transporter n=2 Tax=Moniliophthora roreri TaxID=221103 RepID=V2XDT0_MONRO|nr:nucleotide-sugar transporter [Moniliophthora roreri MCA 2997]KAI3597005.1 nucleotide-sugar transporter [Moniliophthora roreri]
MARPSGISLDEPLRRQSSLSEDEDVLAELEEQVHIASIEEKKRLWWRNAVINSLFIASWFFFATMLSVYNKWMFSDQHLKFSYPLFVTTLHMIVQFSLSATALKIWPKQFKPATKPTVQEYGKKAAPTAFATSLDIGLSNLSLKTISLSFYTMCKSSSLIFVLLFAFLFKLEKFSWRLVGVISLIFSGVLLMVATETHFVLGGFLLVISASGLGGFRWALTQMLLKNRKIGFSNPVVTIFWLSPCMAVTLGCLSVVIESWGTMFRSEFFAGFSKSLQTILFLIAPGFLAFCMVLSEFYILHRAGVVPMSIAGIAKEVTTIMISAWFFGDELTPLNITGVAITVCGIGLYTYHKYRKSLESTVPLDGHGNPISDEDETDPLVAPNGDHGYQVELDETTHLTLRRASEESNNDNDNAHLLFSAEDEQELGRSGSANDLNGSVDSGKEAPPVNRSEYRGK